MSSMYGLLHEALEHQHDKHREKAIGVLAADRKYGECLAILVEEVGEVAKAMQDGDERELLKELVQVCACAWAWAQAVAP